MKVISRTTKSILTPQAKGFLASPPYPFTHTLSAYTGCGFGNTTCGLYCYAQFMPNWLHMHGSTAWGTAVEVKENAAALLQDTLARMSTEQRSKLRIFMSSTTDPYQPIEVKHRLTRQCLQVFAQYSDLDLLVIQTRSPLAAQDFDLIRQLPYAWLSVTIETDDQAVLGRLRGGPALTKRFALVNEARQQGIKTQIAVSPCLPYTDRFALALVESQAQRVIVDNCVDGDGARGQRTARSLYASYDPHWRNTEPSRMLFDRLKAAGVDVGWSTTGFCGIPPRPIARPDCT